MNISKTSGGYIASTSKASMSSKSRIEAITECLKFLYTEQRGQHVNPIKTSKFI